MMKFLNKELSFFDPNRDSSHDSLSRLNVPKDEAIALIESHQQNCCISEEVQQVFRK
jgi:hypothetical protein